MLTGRQITWMLYENFKLSETDGAMLEWDAIMNVKLKGDNLSAFLTDWENTILNINSCPEEQVLESVVRREITNSEQFKNAMALHEQDVNVRGVKRSYDALVKMVKVQIEATRLQRNRNQMEKNSNLQITKTV